LEFQSGNWQIRKIPDELQGLSKVKQQRVLKACPAKYLNEYDATLWVDGNLTIMSDMFGFVSKYDLSATPIWTKKHPSRRCIYDEANAVIRLKKDIRQTVGPQMTKYHTENFPKDFGLHETSVILRRRCRETEIFGNLWAKEILDHSHRDQLSFDYCRWKLNQKVGLLKIGNLTKDPNFRWRKHG
jgi:hypothetical protein